jgi:(1->4)-alpha-D-glucan 1-alpha-D-glucosylmutase
MAPCLQRPAAVDVTTRALRIPVSTYRLQFNSQFTFADAGRVAPYLRDLGITDCYASSYLKAVPGSSHGYDIADPTRLNPEIGSDDEYWAWVETLHALGMSHVLDIVPNHMGIAKSANPWWQDVLENGPSSRFAHFFDIEWHPVKDELAEKVLIPILGDQYGAALERQELQLAYRDGAFVVTYYGDWLPVAPDTFDAVLAPGLDEFAQREASVNASDVEELRSIITATEHLPPRTTRDADTIAVRAREKEVVKRRLMALLEKSAPLARFVAAAVERLNGQSGQARSFDALDDLLNRQSYRLAHWRVASEEINYRRFFDVNQLAALRMEDPAVFAEVHRFVFELMARGAMSGLRVDHVDGLFAPGDYLRRLQERACEALGSPPTDCPVFLVVEKILGPSEQLSREWPVHGTTGYEFAAVVNGLFVDGRQARTFDDIYARFLRVPRQSLSFDELAYRSKKAVMHHTMSGDINALGHQLNRFSERNRHFRDFTLYSLISTLREVIACFPVYRTYLNEGESVTEHDRRSVTDAIRCAKQRGAGPTALVFDFVQQLLLRRKAATAEEHEAQERFVGKFQQITSPVAAKGIEDTALYVYNRLLSLNEVGSDPRQFGVGAAEVHQWMARRRERWPLALSATSTHDTKRGEVVRARLNVLSEMPGEWRSAAAAWRAMNRRVKREIAGAPAPDSNEEYFIYQTLVGAWPFAEADEAAFIDRLKQYLVKACREAKVHTSWLNPDEQYEEAVLAFVSDILDPRRPFLKAFRAFAAQIAERGIWNSLAQAVIKITAPGIPDFYQGTELWDLSLVDPDNRRPVDYSRREALMRELPDAPCAAFARSLVDARTDGRIKFFTIARALAVRASMREVFECGGYEPLAADGAHKDRVFAYARTAPRGGGAIVCVPRLVAARPSPPFGEACWEDTRIALPASVQGARWRHAFTGAVLEPDGDALAAAAVFQDFPVALLTKDSAFG